MWREIPLVFNDRWVIDIETALFCRRNLQSRTLLYAIRSKVSCSKYGPTKCESTPMNDQKRAISPHVVRTERNLALEISQLEDRSLDHLISVGLLQVSKLRKVIDVAGEPPHLPRRRSGGVEPRMRGGDDQQGPCSVDRFREVTRSISYRALRDGDLGGGRGAARSRSHQ